MAMQIFLDLSSSRSVKDWNSRIKKAQVTCHLIVASARAQCCELCICDLQKHCHVVNRILLFEELSESPCHRSIRKNRTNSSALLCFAVCLCSVIACSILSFILCSCSVIYSMNSVIWMQLTLCRPLLVQVCRVGTLSIQLCSAFEVD